MAEQNILVLGMGATGLSVARYLDQQQRPFSLADSRPQPPKLAVFQAQFPDVPIHLGAYDPALLANSSEIIISPGIPLSTPAVRAAQAQGISVYGDIELFARELPKHKEVIAITGTNGKSTVTSLVSQMAELAGQQVAAGGNLSPPALDLLAKQEAELYVLELSSFQLETVTSLSPKVATILNIYPDHMDRYDTFNDYVQAKHRIYHSSQSLVINREESICLPRKGHHPTVTHYGLDTAEGDDFGTIQINSKPSLISLR